MKPNSEILADAIRAHRAGKLDVAEAGYLRILASEANHAPALHLLGVIAHQRGQHQQAADYIQRAIAIDSTQSIFFNNLGEVLRKLRRFAEAIAAYEHALRLKPDSAGSHYNLGNAFKDAGRLIEAVDSYRRAIRCDPGHAETYINLGNASRDLGQAVEAANCYRHALHLKPNSVEAYNNLGNVLIESGQAGEAVNCLQAALTLAPRFAEAHCNLGRALSTLGRLTESVACYRRAVELRPRFAEAHYNVGFALQEQGHLTAATASLQEALRCNPDFVTAYNNLGVALRDQGRVEEAIDCFRRGLEIQPDHVVAHSNLVFTQHYRFGVSPDELAEAHREFDRLHAAPFRQAWQPHGNDRDLDRHLRLGFVSADFRRHPVGYFLIRVLENLPATACETICYCDQKSGDELTARFQAAAVAWRTVRDFGDDQLVEQIRSDRIDVLFDLAGHTSNNRLMVFARKPAPIQVTWIGYEGTTGLEAMDYVIADHRVLPPQCERFHRERVLRMPDGYLCYDPPAAPDPGPLPALQNGFVTFGCFSNLAKISRQVIRVWEKILRDAPRSRFKLQSKGLGDAGVQRRLLDLFAAEGVETGSLQFAPRTSFADYVQAYQQVDIVLDTFPFSGGTTTCESLWMGVPVITLPGETFASRHGLTHLFNLGLAELVAANQEKFVEIALGLAGDLPRLAALRAELRPRMAASPLCDGPRFAENLTGLLRSVWREWCASHG
jgi:protein O-GlcNAc transferase